MGGTTSYYISCPCGYKTSIRVGTTYRRVEKPWVEVRQLSWWQQIKRMLQGQKPLPRTETLREHVAATVVPCIDHSSSELVAMVFSDAKENPEYTPLAIGALESASYLRDLGMNLDHPGPALTCPKCGGSEVRAVSGMHMTLGYPKSPCQQSDFK